MTAPGNSGKSLESDRLTVFFQFDPAAFHRPAVARRQPMFLQADIRNLNPLEQPAPTRISIWQVPT